MGAYDPSLAQAIVRSQTNATLPLVWGAPIRIATFSTPILGDAFAASSDGAELVAAASTFSGVSLYQSQDFGNEWASLTAEPVSGASPQLALGNTTVLLSTLGPSGSYAYTVSLSNDKVASVDLPAFVGAAPVYVPDGGGFGIEGILGARSDGGLDFYSSGDGGTSYSLVEAGSYAPLPPDSVNSLVGLAR